MSKINDEGFLELSGINAMGSHEELNAAAFPILQGLTPLNLRVLNQSSKVMTVAKGVEVIHAGDSPHDLYFISKGALTIGKEINGELKAVAKLKTGDIFGEYGVLRGKTRFASAFTSEMTTLVRVGLQDVQQVIRADSGFSERLHALMKERMLSSFMFSYPIFSGISTAARDFLAKKLVVTEVPEGAELFKSGEKATHHYLLLSGEVEILVNSGQKQVMLEIRRDNDIIGETRTPQGLEYAYTARAATPLDVLVLDKVAMQLIQQVDAGVVPKLKELISSKVKRTMTAIQQLQG